MPSSSVETLILRFRDLVTTPGGTIDLHNKTIKDQGFVWWGWWSKAGEKVPLNEFTHLKQIAQDKDLTILLYDSGSGQVFSAICQDIEWDSVLALKPSPDIQATPHYYRDQEYKTWFKLSKITKIDDPEVEVHRWTYVRVDEFFEQEISRYEHFYDKQVFSPGELQQQNRTIWFVRQFQAGDKTHEISLLDAVMLSPADFPQGFSVHASSTLLWLSDLHFSTEGHHGFPIDATATPATFPLWHRVEDALTIPERKIGNVAGALVSGDFAWKAKKEEFDQAKDSIAELSKKLVLDNYDFLICPGNHDIAFSDDPSLKEQPITKSLAEASQEYRSFYTSLFYKEPNEYLASGRRLILGRSVPVEIAALNSNFLQQHPNVFQGHGFVGQEQLKYVAKEMGWDKPQQDDLPIRVVMLHHHLLPVTFTEIPAAGQNYSVTLDAEAIVRWIVQHKVKIVLHGHMHQPFYAKIGRSFEGKSIHEFWVLGIGSAGVSRDHLGEVQRNTMGLLRFSPTKIEFSTYTLHPTNESSLLWDVTIPLGKG